MKKILNKYYVQLNLLKIMTIGSIILAALFYFLIPEVLNYPANTWNNNFQYELEGTNYNIQVISISFAIWLVFLIIIFIKTKFLINIKYVLSHLNEYDTEYLENIKTKIYYIPYKIYLLNMILPPILITILHAFTIHQFGVITLKIFMLLCSFITIFATIVLIHSTKLFTNILVQLPVTETTLKTHSKLKGKIFYHIFPLLIVAAISTALLGYVRVIDEKGNALYQTYSDRLLYYIDMNKVNIDSEEDLFKLVSSFETVNDNDYYFIKKPDGKYYDINKEEIQMSPFFKKYSNEMSELNNNRVYEYYGMDSQGVIKSININNEKYIVGIYFYVSSTDILVYFLIIFAVLLIAGFLVLSLYSNSLTNDIRRIAKALFDIVKTKNVIENKPLPVTSNDEIGDLIISFNQIQSLTKTNIEKIHDSQEMLIEKERLASLGQLVGGIAHNLKTPIMSISGATEGLNDLIKEYELSIGDPEVTNADHHEIAKDMSEWLNKIRSYTEYMSDVITAVKGQAVNMSNEIDSNFTIEELIKRVDILMKHELKNSLITLNTSIEIDKNTIINGNINNLVQVINNIVSNSIQAYEGKADQIIDLNVYEKNNNIVISVKDYGIGIEKDVQEKLFKEMVTTKGKNGTGLGLFMSYSTIRGNFNGNITFESEVGHGTTFYITLPK